LASYLHATRLSHRRVRLAVDEHTAGAGRVQKILQVKHVQTYSLLHILDILPLPLLPP
jgi:hypothetical protein